MIILGIDPTHSCQSPFWYYPYTAPGANKRGHRHEAMIILGVETSCDETAASIVKGGREILSNVVASSAEMHIKTGGIIPEQAARQQIKSILPVIHEAVVGSRLAVDKIDAIAVTVGPGLIGSLLVGVETAKTLAYLWQKPIIPVNHLVAHLYANWLADSTPRFPLIGLVVSGGHTDLVYVKDHSKTKLIGTTRDDAAGECFDKCARILGLPYPGGPAIAAAAASYELGIRNNGLKLFPRPMIDENNFDFSFSGLKTAVLNEIRKLEIRSGKIDNEVRSKNRPSHFISPASNIPLPTSRLAAEIQESIVDVLVEKTLKAVEKYKPKSLILGGGVAANSRLREKFKSQLTQLPNHSISFLVPPPQLCTDNAAVIASCAFFSAKGGSASGRNNKSVPWQKATADPEMTIQNATF